MDAHSTKTSVVEINYAFLITYPPDTFRFPGWGIFHVLVHSLRNKPRPLAVELVQQASTHGDFAASRTLHVVMDGDHTAVKLQLASLNGDIVGSGGILQEYLDAIGLRNRALEIAILQHQTAAVYFLLQGSPPKAKLTTDAFHYALDSYIHDDAMMAFLLKSATRDNLSAKELIGEVIYMLPGTAEQTATLIKRIVDALGYDETHSVVKSLFDALNPSSHAAEVGTRNQKLLQVLYCLCSCALFAEARNARVDSVLHLAYHSEIIKHRALIQRPRNFNATNLDGDRPRDLAGVCIPRLPRHYDLISPGPGEEVFNTVMNLEKHERRGGLGGLITYFWSKQDYLGLSECFMQNQSYTEALASLDLVGDAHKVLRFAQTASLAWYTQQSGCFEPAISFLHGALETVGEDKSISAAVRWRLGYLFQQNGMPKEVLHHFREALKHEWRIRQIQKPIFHQNTANLESILKFWRNSGFSDLPQELIDHIATFLFDRRHSSKLY
ncbi:MAG: hypothetical protein Q9173_003231 [Seirophora scorigena]